MNFEEEIEKVKQRLSYEIDKTVEAYREFRETLEKMAEEIKKRKDDEP